MFQTTPKSVPNYVNCASVDMLRWSKRHTCAAFDHHSSCHSDASSEINHDATAWKDIFQLRVLPGSPALLFELPQNLWKGCERLSTSSDTVTDSVHWKLVRRALRSFFVVLKIWISHASPPYCLRARQSYAIIRICTVFDRWPSNNVMPISNN